MNPTLDLHLPDHSLFHHPGEVVEASTLPAPEKLRILLDWLQDEFALLVADNEGMVGSRSPRTDQVQAALHALGQATPGRRITVSQIPADERHSGPLPQKR